MNNKFCQNCGFEFNRETKYCPGCGIKLEKEVVNTPVKEEKVNVNELQVSAKIGYYSRYVTTVLLIITFLIFIIGTFTGHFGSISSGNSDADGYGILAMIFLAPLMLIGLLIYFISIIPALYVVPTFWIHKKKKVDSLIEVLRIFLLIALYIIFLIPVIIYLVSGWTGVFDLLFFWMN